MMSFVFAGLQLLSAMNGGAAAPDTPSDPAPRTVLPVEIGGGAPLPVHLYVPARAGSDWPLVMVMHGASRNGDDYRDNWMDLAEACDLIIAAPEFSRARFPGSAHYNLGGLGQPADAEPRAFDVVGAIVDAVLEAYALNAEEYVMFGHSAGAQFVHRYMMFRPDPRVRRAIAANAGWYTAPDLEIAWPYGLADAPEPPPSLEAVRALPISLHLGTHDNDPQASNLRRTPEAVAQGVGRFDRGRYMAELTGWPVTEVPGAGHDNALMVPLAVRELFPERIASHADCDA